MVTVLPKKDGCSFPKEVHITAIKTENNCIRRCLGKCILQRPVPVQQSPVPACLMHTKALSTEDTQDEERGGGGEKQPMRRLSVTLGEKSTSVIIHVQGNDHMLRANVIRLRLSSGTCGWCRGAPAWSAPSLNS